MKLYKLHQSKNLELYSADTSSELELPVFPFGISAGFPSPALDFVDVSIDLNKHLIERPASTYYGRVQGQSMKDAGIDDGDLLVIDKSIEPTNGKIAVCYIDGEFTLKRIKLTKEGLWLIPENDQYEPIEVKEEHNLVIWGIVTYVIKKPL